MSKLEARNVVKIYEGSNDAAVKGSNFLVNDGEFIAILGPSGCGKSSTLRMIAGLEEITSGEILFDDKVINGLTPAQRNIALAFESYALYSPMNIFENIAFPLKAAGVPKPEVKRRVNEVAEMFDLTALLKKKPGELSGGQQQRISLARALVRRPNVFLLDEPLSHMDQRNRADIRTRIKYMHERDKITTIYVTHDQEEAVSLADRVMVMSMGEIQQFGTVTELWNKPSNIFVAGFIGEPAINFAQGKVESDHCVSVFDTQWNCDISLASYPKSHEVTVGFRPNKTRITNQKTVGSVEAKVSVVEFAGTARQLTLTIAGEDYRAMVAPDLVVKPGDTVYLHVDPQNVLLFDTKTTNAIY
ncbi:MAG: ABC transporter ATP-binding protein [Lachnospiraceae bacterium]|jgi:multiple sugar transport system ATP-binding protein|nr:ABC transporter ATP-binding protein [Lachnospiraceae bacterium]